MELKEILKSNLKPLDICLINEFPYILYFHNDTLKMPVLM